MTDLLAALAVVLNGIPQGLLALSFGFAAFPTAVAFLVHRGLRLIADSPFIRFLTMISSFISDEAVQKIRGR